MPSEWKSKTIRNERIAVKKSLNRLQTIIPAWMAMASAPCAYVYFSMFDYYQQLCVFAFITADVFA